MIAERENYDDMLIRIASLGFVPGPLFEVSLVTPKSGSFVSSVGGKIVRGACGRVHRVFYDHKVGWIRDLPCGETRVYLEEYLRLKILTCMLPEI